MYSTPLSFAVLYCLHSSVLTLKMTQRVMATSATQKNDDYEVDETGQKTFIGEEGLDDD